MVQDLPGATLPSSSSSCCCAVSARCPAGILLFSSPTEKPPNLSLFSPKSPLRARRRASLSPLHRSGSCVTSPNRPGLFFFFICRGKKLLLRDSCCIFLPQIMLNTEKKSYSHPKEASCMLTPGGFLLGDVAGEDLGWPGVILHTHPRTKATPCHSSSVLFSTGGKTSRPHCSSIPPSILPVKPSAILNGGRSPRPDPTARGQPSPQDFPHPGGCLGTLLLPIFCPTT